MELTLREVEVTKLNLQPGDTLAITIKNDDFDTAALESFKKSIQSYFEGTKVIIFSIPLDHDIKFSVINDQQSVGCGTQSYCEDCNCGKKERAESE